MLFKNWLAINVGAASTDAINSGLAISLNPYYKAEHIQYNRDVQQNTQPHQFVSMNENEIVKRFVDLSGKNQDKALEWSGAYWVAGALSLGSATYSGIMNTAPWSGGIQTVSNYWKKSNKLGTRWIWICRFFR